VLLIKKNLKDVRSRDRKKEEQQMLRRNLRKIINHNQRKWKLQIPKLILGWSGLTEKDLFINRTVEVVVLDLLQTSNVLEEVVPFLNHLDNKDSHLANKIWPIWECKDHPNNIVKMDLEVEVDSQEKRVEVHSNSQTCSRTQIEEVK